jgi:uncharacterized protein (UPF0303 family)
MATYAQTPGLLNIKGVFGAHFSCQLDFGTSLTGYTFDSAIVLQEYPTKREQAVTVTIDNAGSGIITLSLTEAQTTALGAISNKKWYLNWTIGGIKQTILAGNFELSDIPLGQNVSTSTGVTINAQSVDITLSAFSNAALDGKQPLDADLTAIAGLSPSNDDFLQRKSGSWTNRSIAQVKTDLGVSNVDNTSDLNKPISTATQGVLNNKLDSTLASATYQPLDSDLTSIAGITPSNDDIIQRKAGAWTNRSISQYKTDLALNNVDNTSDLNKPISTATQTALNGKLDSATAATIYQPLDSNLSSIAGLSPIENDIIQRKAGNWTTRTPLQLKAELLLDNVDNTADINKPLSNDTISALSYKVNTNQISTFGYSLIDDADASAARTTLQLGSIATQNSNSVSITGGSISGITDISLADGGTNASLTAVAGGVVYSGASALAITSAGIANQVLRSNGTGAPDWVDVATLTAITPSAINAAADNTTASAHYPVFVSATGVSVPAKASNTKLSFTPSTGVLSATGFSGNLTGNVTGSVSGNVTGSVSGNVTGNVTGVASGNLANVAAGYIIVSVSDSDISNGNNLRNAYTLAKTITPHGFAISATNRISIILPPANYNLATTPLTMDAEFIDLIGLSDDPKSTFITSQITTASSGTIVQSSNDAIIRNITIDRTSSPGGSGATRTAAYFPNPVSSGITTSSAENPSIITTATNHGLVSGDSVRISGHTGSTPSINGVHIVTRINDTQVSIPVDVTVGGSGGTITRRLNRAYIENCVFSGTSSSGMREVIEYSGTYRRCVGGAGSFSGAITGSGANASGLFEDCTATSSSFGGSAGSASGIFTRCSAGSDSFGSAASGTFTDCTAGATSFGGQIAGSATGTFLRCTVNGAGFGSSSTGGTATGTFTDCTLTNTTSYGGTLTGTLRRCRFVCTGTNNNALRVGAGAKIFDSTLIATGTGESITAGSAVTISLAGCRMNKSINANVSNNLGTLTESYNLIDEDIT